MEKIRDWRKYLIVGFGTILILSIIEIWASNTAASLGEKLVQVNKLQQEISWENLKLENDLASLSSLDYIASVSANLGFYKAQTVQYFHQ